jgi:hypothetical protein
MIEQSDIALTGEGFGRKSKVDEHTDNAAESEEMNYLGIRCSCPSILHQLGWNREVFFFPNVLTIVMPFAKTSLKRPV